VVRLSFWSLSEIFRWSTLSEPFSIPAMSFIIASSTASDLWPFFVLIVSVAWIVVGIGKLRLHAFLALILAAIIAGVLASFFPMATIDSSTGEPVIKSLVDVVGLVTAGFGKTAGGVAVSIGLASIIGMAMMESGAADKVVRRFLKIFGEKNAGFALLVSTYILSVPIFFDTMFMLMAPLAKALRVRTGKDYLLYVLCVCCGGVVTHSMTVPHPGPIAMVENLKLDVGLSILSGFAAGILPALGGFGIAVWMNKRWTMPLRETPGSSLSELEALVNKRDEELPSFFWSMVPIVLPIALISLSSLIKVMVPSGVEGEQAALVSWFGGPESFQKVRQVIDFVGDKNIALFIGTFIALGILVRQCGIGKEQIEAKIAPALETAGIIILITSAGGAFGAMIKNAGVGAAVEKMASGAGLSLILVSYLLALILRVAQGSATVAMLTASSIVYPMIQGGGLPYHPMYLYLAIGFAAFSASWMNDSGFWVVSRLSGLTEKETLKSFSVMLTLVSALGLAVTLVASKLMPFAG
jgi:gluconate:H+ symporter, GntP family